MFGTHHNPAVPVDASNKKSAVAARKLGTGVRQYKKCFRSSSQKGYESRYTARGAIGYTSTDSTAPAKIANTLHPISAPLMTRQLPCQYEQSNRYNSTNNTTAQPAAR